MNAIGAADDIPGETYRRVGLHRALRLGREARDRCCGLLLRVHGPELSPRLGDQRGDRAHSGSTRRRTSARSVRGVHDDLLRRRRPDNNGMAPQGALARPLDRGLTWVQIDPRLGRLGGEPVVTKSGASAFFGTPMNALLVSRRVDPVLVLGATTSGCVRASVLDSVSTAFPLSSSQTAAPTEPTRRTRQTCST